MNRFYFPPPIFSRFSNNYMAEPQSKTTTSEKKQNCDLKSNERSAQKECPPKIYDTIFLEFKGIKLKGDDLLILLLIYFLYKQNINDNLLLIALFSLLF